MAVTRSPKPRRITGPIEVLTVNARASISQTAVGESEARIEADTSEDAAGLREIKTGNTITFQNTEGDFMTGTLRKEFAPEAATLDHLSRAVLLKAGIKSPRYQLGSGRRVEGWCAVTRYCGFVEDSREDFAARILDGLLRADFYIQKKDLQAFGYCSLQLGALSMLAGYEQHIARGLSAVEGGKKGSEIAWGTDAERMTRRQEIQDEFDRLRAQMPQPNKGAARVAVAARFGISERTVERYTRKK